jgi:hypothetical protein
MKDIPQWVLESLHNESILCHKCDKTMTSKNIRACGVRDSFKNNKKETLFLELYCLKCDEITIYEMENMSLIEFSFEIMEEIEKQSVEEHDNENVMQGPAKGDAFLDGVPDMEDMEDMEEIPAKIRKRKSKITDKEIKEVVKFLQNNNKPLYHEDFLVELGLSPAEIEYYRYTKD